MKLSIMQPYFFPYIGYFQLIAASDRFVVYDDVTFIKQGWVNRNRILLDGKEKLFTVPVKDQTSYRAIKDTEAVDNPIWRRKFFTTLSHAYRKAPFYEKVTGIIGEVLESKTRSIGALAFLSVVKTCSYIGIAPDFITDLRSYDNNSLNGQARVLDICKKEKADTYINASGGTQLYSREDFQKEGVRLQFLKPRPISYSQGNGAFVPWLSIIDVMMFNSPETIRGYLTEFDLI